jgi:hypothetical protein
MAMLRTPLPLSDVHVPPSNKKGKKKDRNHMCFLRGFVEPRPSASASRGAAHQYTNAAANTAGNTT